MTAPMKMMKATNDIIECLEAGKKVQSMSELMPLMMILQLLEEAIDDFVENKLKPIHEAVMDGRDPFENNGKNPPDIDWDAFLKNLKPGDPS